MSDSDTRPASPEAAVRLVPVSLREPKWGEVARALEALGMYASAQAIREQVWPLPVKIGAVIRAARVGEASTQVYLLAALSKDEDQLLQWRCVESGDWVHSRHLHCLEILAPGVDL